MIVSAFRVPDQRAGSPRDLDWAGIAVLAVMLGSLSFGMNRVDTAALLESLASMRVWPYLVLSFALIPLFIRIEKTAAEPVLRLGLIRRRQVALVCLFATVAGTVEAAFVFMTDFNQHALGVDDRTASFMLLPLVVAVSIAAPIAGRMLDAVGSKRIIAGGLVFMAMGMGVLAWVTPSTLSFYAGSIAIGLGLACLLGSALSYILLTEAEASERTVAQGINTLFISVGQLLGSATIGAIAASAASPATGYQKALAGSQSFPLFCFSFQCCSTITGKKKHMLRS